MEEEQCPLRNIKPFKADFRCQSGFIGRSIVNSAIENRTKLYTVFSVEYNSVNRIGVLPALNAIQNYIAYGDFTEQRLS